MSRAKDAPAKGDSNNRFQGLIRSAGAAGQISVQRGFVIRWFRVRRLVWQHEVRVLSLVQLQCSH
jgi:hypothetical protein